MEQTSLLSSPNLQKSPQVKERNYWIDLGRLIMAFFVIGVHTTRQIGWDANLNQPMVLLNSTIFRTAVPFFFLCSSYFAYDHYLSTGKDPKVFLKSGLRYFAIYLFWVTLYLGIILSETYVGQNKDSLAYAAWFFQELFLNAPISVFWFMRATAYGLFLLGLLFMIPKMKPIYLLPFVLILYFFGAFGDAYIGFLNSDLLAIYNGYFKIFYYARNLTLFGSTFLVLGCLIREYQDKIPQTKKADILIWSGFGLSIVLLFLESWLLYAFSKPKDYNITFSLLLLDPLLFLGLLRIKKPLKLKAAPYFGDLSSLMYFIHIAFRDLYNNVFKGTAYESNWHLRFFLVVVFTLFAASAIVITTHSSKLRHYVY